MPKAKKDISMKMTRRELVRNATLTSAALILPLTIASCNRDKNSASNTEAAKQQTPSRSAFQDDTCRDHNTEKYTNYDVPQVYPVLALWLLLTTDAWEQCFSKDAWRKQLAAELGMVPEHLQFLYDASQDDDPSHLLPFSNRAAFKRIRDLWQAFIAHPPIVPNTSTPFFYGSPPCPGGKTLLQIAKGLK